MGKARQSTEVFHGVMVISGCLTSLLVGLSMRGGDVPLCKCKRDEKIVHLFFPLKTKLKTSVLRISNGNLAFFAADSS